MRCCRAGSERPTTPRVERPRGPSAERKPDGGIGRRSATELSLATGRSWPSPGGHDWLLCGCETRSAGAERRAASEQAEGPVWVGHDRSTQRRERQVNAGSGRRRFERRRCESQLLLTPPGRLAEAGQEPPAATDCFGEAHLRWVLDPRYSTLAEGTHRQRQDCGYTIVMPQSQAAAKTVATRLRGDARPTAANKNRL